MAVVEEGDFEFCFFFFLVFLPYLVHFFPDSLGCMYYGGKYALLPLPLLSFGFTITNVHTLQSFSLRIVYLSFLFLS